MPCTDGGIPYPPTREEILNKQVPMAVLCAVVTNFGVAHIAEIVRATAKQSGVSETDFRAWWMMHSARDQQRKAHEAYDRKQRTLKAQALAKLTPAERKALGS